MNTNLGYSKKTLTNTDVLLSGGGNKPLTDFIGSISWDATNRKLKYTPVGGSTTDLVTFGSNAFNSVAYLPLAGGVMANTNLVTNLNADMLDGYHSSDFGRVYTYSMPDDKCVRITFGGRFSAIISVRCNRSGGGLTLVGNGYGWNQVRNTWAQISPSSIFRWNVPATDSLSRCIEISKTTNINETSVIHVLQLTNCTVTFEEIDTLTTEGKDEPIANLNSNVASATKLQTSRTIWGQSFDGSANVTGAMSSVTNIDSLLYFDTTNSRIGIGTNTPSEKLHVNGKITCGNILAIGTSTRLIFRHLDGLKLSDTDYNLYLQFYNSDYKTFFNGDVYYIKGGEYNGNAASSTLLATSRTIWGQSFNGASNVSGNMTDVGSISANGNIAITRTSESAIFRATASDVSIDLRVNTSANRGVYDATTGNWIIATNGTYTVINQGNVGIGVTPTEKLDVNGIILGTSVKAGAIGINNTSKTSGNGISLYNGLTSGAPTNGIMFAGTDTFGTCGGVTYTWSTYFTVSNKTNIGWIFRRGSTNVASIDGNGSGYFSSSLTSSAVYTPSVEFKNVASGTGNGGYIDFHYDGASSYTSRIIESASGNIEASCTNFITNGTQFNLLSDESLIKMRVPSSTSYERALSYRGTTASNADLYVGSDTHDTRLTGRDVYIMADETTVMSIKHSGNRVGISTSSPSYKLEVNGDCGATNFVSTSDVRLKNIISYLVPDLNTIAAAPGFLFKWKDQEKGTKIYAGTSALYWYDKFSYVVHKANDLIGTLAIQHDVLGVLCSISIARELKMLKEEVQEIKEYINNHLQ